MTIKKKYHCLNVWAIPLEVLQISDTTERVRVISTLVQTLEEPPENLATIAPMSWSEFILASSGLLLALGGPLIWLSSLVYVVVLAPNLWWQWLICSAFLSFHPLPQSWQQYVIQSKFTLAVYKYFSYRLVWTDDALELSKKHAPFLGAGPPHGVLPLANLMSVPALQTCFGIDFVGTPASVVFYTPFLRYLTLYPCIPVSKSSIVQAVRQNKCVGLAPDGIYGIFCSKQQVALLHRKGMARLATTEHVSVLPAYSFGNTKLLKSWYDPWGVMERTSRKAKVSIVLFWGRWGLPLPYRSPVTLAFDAPICAKPNQSVDEVHQLILQGIQTCFDTHKSSLGYGDQNLSFI